MEIELHARDGRALSASFWPGSRNQGAVLIVGAMGVAQAFYAPLAAWLSERGFATLTFDFRGMGRSRRGPLAKEDASILTWAELDAAAALDALAMRAPDVPLTWIGHSLGGQIVPFVPNRAKLSKIVTIATGSGYWRENAAPLRRRVWLFWWGAVPIATPLFGYFPGRRLRMVGDLPRNVIRQWRSWCLNPNYALGVERGARALFEAVDTPLTALAFTDDEMMSRTNVESIHRFYSGAPKVIRHWSPVELEVRRVGHFGFFRANMTQAWEKCLAGELAARPIETDSS